MTSNRIAFVSAIGLAVLALFMLNGAEAATLKVVGRSSTVTIELTQGGIIVTTRSGTVSVGVE